MKVTAPEVRSTRKVRPERVADGPIFIAVVRRLVQVNQQPLGAFEDSSLALSTM